MTGKEWHSSSSLYCLMFIWVAGFVMRVKFYNGFTASNLTADLSGICWNSKNQDNSTYKNFDFWGVEWDQRVMIRMKSWNIAVQKWLNDCCYNRCWYLTSIDFKFGGKRFVIKKFNKSYAA